MKFSWPGPRVSYSSPSLSISNYLSLSFLRYREIQRDVPNRSHTFSCLSSPAIWVTVISVKGAVGLGSARNVYCLLKCENQKVKSQISKSDKEIEWSDVFVFYRKYPERPIVVKVLFEPGSRTCSCSGVRFSSGLVTLDTSTFFLVLDHKEINFQKKKRLKEFKY